ncbi:MAG: cobalt ABC transporter permease, partial [Shewanella sp.]
MWVSCSRWRLFVRRCWSRECQETMLCALSLFFVCILSACAFVLPVDLLLPLAAINGFLVLHGLARRGSIMGVVKLGVIQLTITLSLYLLLYGVGHLAQGAVVVGRIMLATIPGWWLCITAAPERIGEVLSAFLPSKWAFVVAASLSLL